jgi:transcription-repair coupling factor (superfamily II helicase)
LKEFGNHHLDSLSTPSPIPSRQSAIAIVLSSSSSLAFRSLLKGAAAKSGLARPVGRLTGLTSAATAYHAAAVAQESIVFLVVPTDADVEQMIADARFFLSAMKGLADAEAVGQVLPFPSQEVDPYRGLTPHLQIASARARALSALATGSARLVVASARALLPRLTDPRRLAETSLTLRPGLDISPQELGERLARAGFSPQDPVDEHGEFFVRGGIVDLYPASEIQPVRLEFIGDIVESVRRYDAATQRSLMALSQVDVRNRRHRGPRPNAGRAVARERRGDADPWPSRRGV